MFGEGYAASGTSGAQFLKLGAGSRAAGMAEACSALTDDVYSLYYNPGALTAIAEPQLGGAHSSMFQGANYEYIGFAYPLKTGTVGAALYNLSVPDIERRTGDTLAPNGTFSAGDYSYGLSYAYRVSKGLGVGVTGKVIYQTLDTYSSTAFGLDAGAQWKPDLNLKRPVTFAFVLKNLGTPTSFAGGVKDPLPLGVTLGAASELSKRFRADVDLTKYRDTDPYVSLGGEWLHPFKTEGVTGVLRFGYTTARLNSEGSMNGIALGAGVQLHRAAFDFAWVPFGDLGDTFRFSLMIKFAARPAAATAAASSTEVPAPSAVAPGPVAAPAAPPAPPTGMPTTPSAPAPGR